MKRNQMMCRDHEPYRHLDFYEITLVCNFKDENRVCSVNFKPLKMFSQNIVQIVLCRKHEISLDLNFGQTNAPFVILSMAVAFIL